jgi:hypothetical protein
MSAGNSDEEIDHCGYEYGARRDKRSEVGGQRSEVRGQRSEVGGRKSEDSQSFASLAFGVIRSVRCADIGHRAWSMGHGVRNQRSEVRGQRTARASRHLPSASLGQYAALTLGIGHGVRNQRSEVRGQRTARASRHLPSASLGHYAALTLGIGHGAWGIG